MLYAFYRKETACVGYIRGRTVMLWSVLQTINKIFEAGFAKKERGELRRFARKKLNVKTPYRAETTYWRHVTRM